MTSRSKGALRGSPLVRNVSFPDILYARIPDTGISSARLYARLSREYGECWKQYQEELQKLREAGRIRFVSGVIYKVSGIGYTNRGEPL